MNVGSRPVEAIALAAVLFLAPACVDAPAAAPEDAPKGSTELVENATMPADDQAHLHDYWNGRDRVVLFDGTVEPSSDETLEGTLILAFVERQPGKVGMAHLHLPEGRTVYEGTGELVLTATWSDPKVTSLAVSYRSALGPNLSEPVPLASGSAWSLSVTPEMTDLPHTSTSRWRFVFMPSTAPGAVAGPFQVKVEIVKLRDVDLFPAHPDLFEGRREKVVLDRDGKSAQVSYAKRVPNFVMNGEFGEHEIAPQKVLPMETESIQVFVNVTKADASVGTVSEIRFFYRTADTAELQRVRPVTGDMIERRYTFRVPVDATTVDSPYAHDSQWRFLVEAATKVSGADEERTCGGCVDTDIEFHITAIAYDHDFLQTGAP